MKKILVILFCLPLFCSAQIDEKVKTFTKDFFKYSTVYGAVNGNTSVSDVDIYSVTNGLETQTIETPYDYSVLFGARKIKGLDMNLRRLSKMELKIVSVMQQL